MRKLLSILFGRVEILIINKPTDIFQVKEVEIHLKGMQPLIVYYPMGEYERHTKTTTFLFNKKKKEETTTKKEWGFFCRKLSAKIKLHAMGDLEKEHIDVNGETVTPIPVFCNTMTEVDSFFRELEKQRWDDTILAYKSVAITWDSDNLVKIHKV